MDLFGIGPLLTKLLAGAGVILAGLVAWKANGALRERKGVSAGVEKARREQQEIDRAQQKLAEAAQDNLRRLDPAARRERLREQSAAAKLRGDLR